MLRRRVGAPISFASLARDLQIAPIIFTLRPFHKNLARSLLKEPKAYFYDSGYVDADEGVRLENTAAACLLKHVHYLQDAKGREVSLHYIRTKDGKEVDFALADKGELTHLIEVKLCDQRGAIGSQCPQ
ncbi:MAG: DUF4143 domain-containing protein [Elusimicrobiota bacterium]